ncbi:MAG: hypothetical protein JNL80_12460 [Phycisphaerae bacterium]|nr:hypothetical protein [Phycisphaerae bacterium]
MLVVGAVRTHAAPPPPVEASAHDLPWDDGTAIEITWRAPESATNIAGYRVYRLLSTEEQKRALRDRRVAAADVAWKAAYESNTSASDRIELATAAATAAAERAGAEGMPDEVAVGTAAANALRYVAAPVESGRAIAFRVRSFDADGNESPAAEAGSAAATIEIFLGTRAWFFPLLIGLCAIIIGCILLARAGRPIKVRRIAGLDAIDEAVGRATEMGRPVLYIAGVQDMDNVQTVAGVTILGRVAKIAAEYDAKIEVPTARSLVMTAARDVVQTAYFEAGRHDAYNPDTIRYITDEQFGYVAYVAGRMVREKPATCIYMGQFYAESLLLSENGNAINAIQIAGTAESSQLPFFVAACDYTLIGEEFFAASAYLAGEPTQLGSLFGQDVSKLIAMVVIVAGVILSTLGGLGLSMPKAASDYLANSILAS